MRLALLSALLPAVVLGGEEATACDPDAAMPERIACLEAELARLESELDRIWPLVLEQHPSGGDRAAHAEEIRAAQQAWTAFRDAECEAVSKVGIPRWWAMNRLECLTGLTGARISALTETYLR